MEDEFFEKLIESVRDKDILYNKRHQFYYNRIIREAEWQEVAKICGRTAQDCQHRWKLLRERFAKEIRKIEAPSGSGARYLEEWKYLQPLMYLKDSLAPRKTRSNEQDDFGDPSPSYSDAISPPPAKKNKLENMYQKFGNIIEQMEKENTEPSADEAFMLSVVSLMRDLPGPVKDRFQEDTYRRLYELRSMNRPQDSYQYPN